ncbi:MAG: peptidylprolyl isomerase [Oscillospiraceae bacterium]|nr:peptidylprolyl isomerase [Oscillospiraceae bacterium]
MESGGKIVLELYPDKAPNTVNNFISLAAQGKYDGVIFHRVISNFMIQGGDFENGDGTGGPGYMIKGEMSANNNEKNDISHVRGVISMARRGGPPGSDHLFYNTAGSQFFIVVEDSEFLDNIYTAFGMVIEGFDTVDKIRDARTDMSDRPLIDQKIKQVTVETFGVEYKDPEIIKE